MSLDSGIKKVKCIQNVETQVAGERTMPGLIEGNIFSRKKVLRGFEKRPIVLLERCNAIPFLTNNHVTHNPKANVDAGTNEIDQINLHLEKLALQCSVVLIREDLEKLKRDICKKCIGYTTRECKAVSKGIKTANNSAMKQNKAIEMSYKVDKGDARPQKRVSFSEHIIVHVVADYNRCGKCKKIFKDFKALKSHISRRHSKRKRYICNYCSKIFLDRTPFKHHIKLHCNICGVLAQNKVQCLDHRRNVCCSVKKYTCRICNESYLSLMDLKEHSYEHIGTFFICDICKDQFEHKCALVHHITFLHSEKHPNKLYTSSNSGSNRRYRCNFCKMSSMEQKVLESHTSILPDLNNRATTTYKDYCFCDRCLRRFDTETNMLQHKLHDRKKSNNLQLQQEGLVANYNDTKSTEEAASLSNEYNNFSKDSTIFKKPARKPMLYNILKPSNALEYASQNPLDSTQRSMEKIDYTNPPKKAIVDPKSKKTILSRFNCELCGKYYSSNYTLCRHKATQHGVNVNRELQCPVCEETFVWPSLLESHKCIRANIPEMPFDDARPEILFDHMGRPDSSSEEDDGAMAMDYDMPAPIVELTEYEPTAQQYNNLNNLMCVMPLPDSNYKYIVQEVPIEF